MTVAEQVFVGGHDMSGYATGLQAMGQIVVGKSSGPVGHGFVELVDENVAFTMNAPDLQLERPSEEWLHILFPQEAEDSRDLV